MYLLCALTGMFRRPSAHRHLPELDKRSVLTLLSVFTRGCSVKMCLILCSERKCLLCGIVFVGHFQKYAYLLPCKASDEKCLKSWQEIRLFFNMSNSNASASPSFWPNREIHTQLNVKHNFQSS